MPSTGAIRPRSYLLMVLPILIAVATVVAELAFQPHGGVSHVLDERLKKVIDMDTDLAKWFIGLGITLIGGTAYYVRALAPSTIFSRVAIVLTILGAVVSVLFGHLWLANMRNMVANDYFDAKSDALIWPERIQYLAFIGSLCWFALLAIERETSPRPVLPQSPSAPGAAPHAAC